MCLSLCVVGISAARASLGKGKKIHKGGGTKKSSRGRPYTNNISAVLRDSVLGGPGTCIPAAFPQSMFFFTLHLYRRWVHSRCI